MDKNAWDWKFRSILSPGFLDLIPTYKSYLSLLLGVCSFFGRLGGVLCPYVVDFGDYWKPLPLLIFGSAGKLY